MSISKKIVTLSLSTLLLMGSSSALANTANEVTQPEVGISTSNYFGDGSASFFTNTIQPMMGNERLIYSANVDINRFYLIPRDVILNNTSAKVQTSTSSSGTYSVSVMYYYSFGDVWLPEETKTYSGSDTQYFNGLKANKTYRIQIDGKFSGSVYVYDWGPK